VAVEAGCPAGPRLPAWVGLVEYEGQLMALGGCREAWSNSGLLRHDMLEATAAVDSYNLRTDGWAQHPAQLPLSLSYACPVVVRMPGVQL
jgi:hypothetical protein